MRVTVTGDNGEYKVVLSSGLKEVYSENFDDMEITTVGDVKTHWFLKRGKRQVGFDDSIVTIK